MTAWREQSFWSKFWVWAWLAFMAVFTSYTGAFWLGDGSSNRKRVFSPGFVVLCVFVAVIELILLNHFYGAGTR
ncbi:MULTISPECIES: hypothetical protein [Pseudomonas]|uniref:Uncharacterized protein n=1 Tax=Pseudomonas azadiae TaxID=2843612 RepID=A0ABS6NWW7_9PSED|nr:MULTISPECIES: hypothetical protein [Pseudomonas]MBV4452714.1 hypothetical protein [Pseudomonas azadiae]NMF42466.1 hypothetical protein [Pseudomonas sp. SWRI 103]